MKPVHIRCGVKRQARAADALQGLRTADTGIPIHPLILQIVAFRFNGEGHGAAGRDGDALGLGDDAGHNVHGQRGDLAGDAAEAVGDDAFELRSAVGISRGEGIGVGNGAAYFCPLGGAGRKGPPLVAQTGTECADGKGHAAAGDDRLRHGLDLDDGLVPSGIPGQSTAVILVGRGAPAARGSVILDVCGHVAEGRVVDRGRVPLKADGLERRTIGKSIIAERCHTGGDGDARQFAAVVKSIRVDRCHTGGDRDARQIGAAVESTGTDACDGRGDRNGRKSSAIAESIDAEARQTFGERDACKIVAVAKSIVADAGDTLRDRNARQRAAREKSINANACYGRGDRDVRKSTATVKRVVADVCQAFGDRDACKIVAEGKGKSSDALQARRQGNGLNGTVAKSIARDGSGPAEFNIAAAARRAGRSKKGAGFNPSVADGFHASGDGDARKLAASAEKGGTDRGHALRDRDGGKRGTIRKGPVADVGDAGSDRDGGKGIALTEGQVGDRCDGRGDRNARHIVAAGEGAGADIGDRNVVDRSGDRDLGGQRIRIAENVVALVIHIILKYQPVDCLLRGEVGIERIVSDVTVGVRPVVAADRAVDILRIRHEDAGGSQIA